MQPEKLLRRMTLAYNLRRLLNLLSVRQLVAALKARALQPARCGGGHFLHAAGPPRHRVPNAHSHQTDLGIAATKIFWNTPQHPA